MTIKERITAFREVRELPYHIATEGEIDCCCSTKATLLEEKLLKLGLRCRHRFCWFKWEDLNLPPEVLSISHEKLPSHQFLEVFVPETGLWTMADCTWDSPLGAALTVVDWDGIHPTSCAVPATQYCSELEGEHILKECADPAATKEYFKTQGEFLRAVNAFLRQLREHPGAVKI